MTGLLERPRPSALDLDCGAARDGAAPTRADLLDAAVRALETTTRPSPGAPVKCGVDLGTACVVLVALDADDRPLACELEPCQVARDGLVVDYHGAIDVVRRLSDRLRERLGVDLDRAAIAVPPGTAPGDAATHRHVVEAAGLEVLAVFDEPTAANRVLGLADGAVVDLGGGTTGVSVFQGGRVVHTGDEPTGGTHMSLVLMGRLGMDYAQTEAFKQDPANADQVRQLVRPVAEKMATIVGRHLAGRAVDQLWLVGGAASVLGIEDVFADRLGVPTRKPAHPGMVTPLGIAMGMPLKEASPC